MTTDQTGTVIEDQLFYPWGQKWYDVGSHTGYRFFAGMKQQDWKTGLDPTLHRMYNSGLGRWLTPDKLGGDVSDPQSLNRYAYVTNNPATFNDPLGLLWEPLPPPSPQPHDFCDDPANFAYCNGIGISYVGGSTDEGIAGYTLTPPNPKLLKNLICNSKFIAAAKKAWSGSGGGTLPKEGSFAINGSFDHPFPEHINFTNEVDKSTFMITPNTIAVFHTHPGVNMNVVQHPSIPNDMINSKFSGNIPDFVGTQEGLFVTDPSAAKKYRLLRPGLDWTKPCS